MEPAENEDHVKIPWWVENMIKDRAPLREHWIRGGIGSGKSHGVVLWHAYRCYENQRSPLSWFIAPTYTQIMNAIIPAFVEVLHKYFGALQHRDYKIVKSKPPYLEFNNGQKIEFHTARQYELMVSASISHVSGTEAGQYGREVVEKVTDRVRCGKANVLQYCFEGSPEGLDNALADYANLTPGVHEELNRSIFELWTEDNKYLPAGYVERQKAKYAYDQAKLDSYLYGKIKPFTKGTAYWEFSHRRNIALDIVKSPHLPVIFAWDFNAHPLSWTALQLETKRTPFGDMRRFVAVEESSGESRGLDDGIAEFIKLFPPSQFGSTPIIVHGDASGYHGSHKSQHDDYARIKQALMKRYASVRVEAVNYNPTVKSRLNRVNQLMAYEMFVIAAHLKRLRESFDKTQLKPGTWDIDKSQGDLYSHPGDSVGYPLYWMTKHWDLEDPTLSVSTVHGTN